MKKNHLISGLAILSIFAISCEKEEDHSFPVISILTPGENQVFSVFDTVIVTASVSDDQTLKYVSILLVNESFTPCLNTFSFTPGTTQYSLSVKYPLNDFYLESGNYYIQVIADDGYNRKNGYREICIHEIPRELESVFIITIRDDNNLNVIRYDTSYSATTREFMYDYSASAVSSRNKQLYMAGRKSLNLVALNSESLEKEWGVDQGMNFPFHDFNCLCFDEYLFVTYGYEYIRGYDANGKSVFNVFIEPDWFPGRILRTGDIVVADIQSKTGKNPQLFAWYLSSGKVKQNRETLFRTVDFFDVPDGILVVANNLNDQSGEIWVYDPESNSLNMVMNLAGNPLICGCFVGNAEYLLSTEEGEYIYNHSGHSLQPVDIQGMTTKIRYDFLKSKIYLGCPGEVKILGYPAFNLEKTIPHQDSVADIQLMYNK